MIVAQSEPGKLAGILYDRHLPNWLAVFCEFTGEIQIDASQSVPGLQQASHIRNRGTIAGEYLRLAFAIKPQHSLLVPVCR